MAYICKLATDAGCQKCLVCCRLSARFMIKLWCFKTLGSWFCIRSHDTCSTFVEYPLLCLMGFRLRCCLPAFVCDWDSSIPNCILFHLRRQSNFSSSVLRHMCGCFSCACIWWRSSQCDISTCPAAESTVRPTGRDSTETERERAGAEEPEEGDRGDEGKRAEFYSPKIPNPHQPSHHHRLFPCAAVCN